ncbi:PAS domain S-box protein [Anaerolineales bacterium HSG24]|nr:PAS domain S-box protein [Anaerolineales bacterium HSG24]
MSILALDAFRTLFESIYFGIWYTSLSGLIPIGIGEFLTLPEMVIIPKLLNVLITIIVIALLLKRWFPQEEQEEYRLLAETMRDVIVRLSPTWKILYVSSGIKEFSGYDPKSEIGNSMSKYFAKKTDLIHATNLLAKVLITRQSGKFEFLFKPKNRKPFPVEYTYIPILKDDKVIAIQLTLRDITIRKQVEKALHESEEQYRNLYENVPVGIFRSNLEGKLLSVNRAFVQILGYESASELKKILMPDIYHDPKHREELFARLMEEGDIENFEVCVKHKDGSLIWISTNIQAIFDEEGKILYLDGTGEDITTRKQVEEALRESEELYRTLFERSNDAIFLVDTQTGQYIDANQAAEQLTGYSLSELKTKTTKDLTPAGAKQRLNQSAILETTKKVGEVTYVRADGTERVAILTVIPLKEDVVIGMAHDITKRKHAEAVLQAREAFLERIIDQSPFAIWISDAEGTLQHANPALKRFVNLTDEQLVGKYNVFQDTVAKRHGLIPCIRTVYEEGQTVNFTCDWDGNDIPTLDLKGSNSVSVEATMFPIHNPEGELTNVVLNWIDITERKQAEKTLEQSKVFLETLIEHLPVGILSGKLPDCQIVLANREAERISGAKREDVFQLDGWHPEKIGLEMFYPDGTPWLVKDSPLSKAVWQGVETYNEEMFLRSADGIERTILCNATPVRDLDDEIISGVVSFQDITDRKQMEQEIWKVNQRMTLAADSAGFGVWDIDMIKNKLMWDDWIFRIFGIDPEGFEGRYDEFIKYLHPDDLVKVNEKIEQAIREEKYADMEYRIVQPTGAIRHIKASAVIMRDNDGKPTRITGINYDVTERKQTENELKEAKDAAEAANRAKSAFISSMSHELRTPLNGILGYTQILAWDKKLDDSHKTKLGIIQQSGNHLLNLINDILDFSKIEAERMELFESSFAFRPFIENIVAMVKVRADSQNIQLTFEADPNLPVAIYSDEKRLSQVIINLLNNAIKFTEQDGGITFSVHRRVESSPSASEASSPALSPPKGEGADSKVPNSGAGKIRFQVADTGIGIPQDKLTDIFSPFKQVGEQAQMIEGTGLGLPISRNLTRLLGGELHVKSRLGEGSIFWFDLNLDEVDTWREVQIIEKQNIIGFEGEKRKILVVDDVFHNQGVLVNILEPLGFDVITANDGREGLRKAIKFQPDLVLMDLVMPMMDGAEATQFIKKKQPDTKVIIVSASSSQALADVQKKSGSDDYLQKPVQMAELFSKIQTHLDLTWIYEGKEEDDFSESVESTDIIPPITELLSLLESAQMSEFIEIETRLIHIEAMNKKYKPFVVRMQELVKSLDADGICNVLGQYLF